MQISVVIITYNEAKNIGRCLESVFGLADEVVVLDSGSTDNTRAICTAAGARVFTEPFAGHIEQKNRAIELAIHPWLLALDADEALSPELQASIKAVKQLPAPSDGYTCNRLNNYCGKWVRYGGWYPDRKLRLWKKDTGKWGGLNPHDKIVMWAGASVNHLQGDLLHFAYQSVEQHIEKTRKYAQISAQAKHAAGKRSYPGLAWLAACWCFIQMYFFRLGLLDGSAGWHIAIVSSREKWLKYKYLSAMR